MRRGFDPGFFGVVFALALFFGAAAIALGDVTGLGFGLSAPRRAALALYLLFCAAVVAGYERAVKAWASPWSPNTGARLSFVLRPINIFALWMVNLLNAALAFWSIEHDTNAAWTFAVLAAVGIYLGIARRDLLGGRVPQAAIEEAALDFVRPRWRDKDFWSFVALMFVRVGVAWIAAFAALTLGQAIFEGLYEALFGSRSVVFADLARAPYWFADMAMARANENARSLIFLGVLLLLQPLFLLIGGLWIALKRRGD